MHNNTKTNILMLLILSWAMSLCMLRTFSGVMFQYVPKDFTAILLGTALGIFMVRDINTYSTRLQKAECFAQYILSYSIFIATYMLTDSVFKDGFLGSEYAGVCSAAVMAAALLVIFAARKKPDPQLESLV